MNNRELGTFYEDVAARYLKARNYQIVVRNYRCRMGEIDLIGWDGDCLVFIEVKYRTTYHQGGAFMAVNPKKQHRISMVAAFYLLDHQLSEETCCRFDVVAIDGTKISLIKNAFDYC
ncbi:MAG: YraN family protein [Lachnospiraceae bacterium]|nr:YraN family protein [Lachnospiraceae bacterium]